MHYFTSINNNYLPKARILAKSVKKHCSNAYFSLVLCDKLPEDVNPAEEPFDEIITVDKLGIPVENLNMWIFMHTVVELCTAVKGQALLNFLNEGSEKVIYLDPDIAVFSPLTELEELLDEHDVILTPHQTTPEIRDLPTIWDNEVCSLKHGVFNFGFFAVKNSNNGISFANWWRDRLVDYCYDDIPNGIFTDQRWGDLVPCLFDGVYVLRDPSYNIATWNINHRDVVQSGEMQFLVNGIPLKFYHFSGFDAGTQEIMLKKYGKDNPALWVLRNWYILRQDEEGQAKYGSILSIYNCFSNGDVIKKEVRALLRNRGDIKRNFENTNPFIVNGYYFNWYEANKSCAAFYSSGDYEQKFMAARAELENIYVSRSWKLTKWIRSLNKFLKRLKNAIIRSR